MDPQQSLPNPDDNSKPVLRGARACTVCRAAKMKCVGAEDGQKQCQRCKRAGQECVFEKHRRGRKPGSKLSEASKMLRRLEKGLNSAKLKSQSNEAALAASYPPNDSRSEATHPLRPDERPFPQTHFPSNQLPPLNLPAYQANGYPNSASSVRQMEIDEEDEDRNDEGLFPAKLIRKEENQRNSFFRTILNPEETPVAASSNSNRQSPYVPPPRATPPSGLNDPVTAGLIDEKEAQVLFDLIFLRLNPFINLFDPELHSVSYVRSRCPFLFTTLIMAGCKFFKPQLFDKCKRLANEFAVRAFAEQWKRVEVVQAFACLTYWKDPDDTRTWMFIGYACRMAIELGLNRYVARPPPNETDIQMLERRNRERTYLVLWVHDRSLSTQTGRQYMLQEDELVRHSETWHEEGGRVPRPEDVIVAAMVQLRRVASETTDMFYSSKGPGINHQDVNYDVVLHNCNGKLSLWSDAWTREMHRAHGETFHFSFLNLFRLGVRLFLNSFGISAAMAPGSRASPSTQALSVCFASASDSLIILSKDFASMSMLRYGQDSITVMSAYAAIFLLKLLRSPNTVALLPDGAAEDSCALITRTANAYHEVSTLSQTSTLAAYHSRFLHSLVASSEISNSSRRMEKERSDNSIQIDPRLQGSTSSHSSVQSSPPQMHSHHPPNSADQSFHFPASPNIPAHPTQQNHFAVDGTLRGRHPSNTAANVYAGSNYFPGMVPQHASELDANYWKHMLLELGMGYGEHAETTGDANVDQDQRHMSGHPEQPHQQYQHAIHQGHPSQGHQVSYQHLQTSQGYDH
ncbi:hypothetical protein PC9H_001236 [Pleurotus ostreatus]|uniref:Zn(2)-C6 fungal-type domain-containing protein n=2 Tax=Pleurotus ostreatus TaxID=5322 RepID=A0A8H7DXB4_PLEOS|nr:uncharacterized protein PC9H_001236 [Pleurotus ostreatus]KAF7440887.1 hypothetical protein PC9H_001236 [Pleurotus ostreatus]